MADIVSQQKRSAMMAGIKGKNTLPEMEIRRQLHQRGFRFRLHHKNLPGKPDIVLPKYNAVILINGCFWHGHKCPLFKWPSSRQNFWKGKIAANKARDFKTKKKLRQQGWRILEVWERSLKGRRKLDLGALAQKISTWIKGDCQYNKIQGERRAK